MESFHSLRFFDIADDIFSLVEQAGQAIRDIYNSDDISIEVKSDNSPVTTADYRSNRIITDGLQTLFRDIPIISEESEIPDYDERKSWDYVWILDPLDGTKGFINRTGEFTINLGMVQKDTVTGGFIYAPISRQMYFAAKGLGAFQYHENKQHRRLSARAYDNRQQGIKVLASRHHNDALTQAHINTLHHPVVMERGAALKFVSIADGLADYYPKMAHIMEWDTAPGQILIEEAGGSVVQAENGLPLKYNKPDLHNPHFIASGKSAS